MKLTEIPVTRLADLGALFPGQHLRMVLGSIRRSNTSARLWALDAEDPGRLCLLWDQGNNIFTLSGEDAPDDARRALGELVAAEVRPAALAQGAPYFSARAATPALAPLVEGAFGPYLGGKREKLFHPFPHPALPREVPGVAGVSLRPIDLDLMGGPLRNADAVEAEVRWMWPTVERFLQHGWGVAAVAEDAVVCWCTAEYVGGYSCGIGIETVAEWQGKGLATAAGTAFVNEALGRGLMPHWECDAQNAASICVAEKLGFACVERHEFLVGRFA